MTNFILQLLTYALPCWFINISLNLLWPLKQKFIFIKKNDLALDLSISLPDRHRLLGTSTTLIGLFLSLGLGIVFQYLILIPHGIFIGICVYLGHATGSFIKRRLDIADGVFLPIIDHGDYVIFTGMVFYVLGYASAQVVLVTILITLIAQPVVCLIGFYIGLRKEKL